MFERAFDRAWFVEHGTKDVLEVHDYYDGDSIIYVGDDLAEKSVEDGTIFRHKSEAELHLSPVSVLSEVLAMQSRIAEAISEEKKLLKKLFAIYNRFHGTNLSSYFWHDGSNYEIFKKISHTHIDHKTGTFYLEGSYEYGIPLHVLGWTEEDWIRHEQSRMTAEQKAVAQKIEAERIKLEESLALQLGNGAWHEED